MRIVEWLNGPAELETAEKERFLRLLKQLQDFELMLNQPETDIVLVGDAAGWINGALRPHLFRPAFIYDDEAVGGFRLGFAPTATQAQSHEPIPVGEVRVGQAVPNEDFMVSLVVQSLWPLGRLGRLRRCENCGRWLFARKDDQRFCSTACGRKNRESTEEFRQYRRNYMKHYNEHLFEIRRRNKREKRV